MRLSILSLLATLTAALALPAEPLHAITPKRSSLPAGLASRGYCPGFGQICFTDDDCRAMQCTGCIDYPEVENAHKICY